MYPPQRIATNIPKEQILAMIGELDRSIEADRAQIGLYRIVSQKLTTVNVTSPGQAGLPMGAEFMLREKDAMVREMQGLVQKKYDEINAKQDVIGFLNRLAFYAT